LPIHARIFQLEDGIIYKQVRAVVEMCELHFVIVSLTIFVPARGVERTVNEKADANQHQKLVQNALCKF
jgi:hypothetical protein